MCLCMCENILIFDEKNIMCENFHTSRVFVFFILFHHKFNIAFFQHIVALIRPNLHYVKKNNRKNE